MSHRDIGIIGRLGLCHPAQTGAAISRLTYALRAKMRPNRSLMPPRRKRLVRKSNHGLDVFLFDLLG
ncbi:hypothetical protein C7U92_18760 [Bradyrhizobium sp. WBOS7]|nr:hypothetical protein [Bradyrhizobium sp. WBOS2]MDD1573349.1 hypothetical protein [Bradyrhizobium sp. WBOS1]MDD1578749.1 hypothetical protein [Bradyrhizobium sp. WBOS7]MDD1602182.1 hypothetical protein [Bradyrhizobium sp. WBOS16]UUO37617.1 hypothetical protein DCK84_25585 [Bradyrhizobium sp. WBOS01]UUO39859.1 hypothetical protein DCM75_03225 [Bradyrhizobium sp. WBOS02]UUO52071.1 hypothetical protein DCM79_03130 [Bradyrhizobium sp. WBOS07]